MMKAQAYLRGARGLSDPAFAGAPRRAGGVVEPATALDRWLPRWDVGRRHALDVLASGGVVWDALERHRFARSGIARFLMALRGYGRRVTSGNSLSFSQSAACFGFVELERVPERELVLGLAGRFWRADGGLRKLSREEFPAFEEDGAAKAVWNIQLSARGPCETELSTETRVLCFGPAARRKFLLYWTVIEPFSALTRVSLLEGVRKEALRAGPCG